MNDMSRVEMGIRSAIADLVAERDVSTTHWCYLGTEYSTFGKNRWAVVLAWQGGYMDGCSEYQYGTYRICCKIAYQPTNSAMQDYEVDWLMPVDEDGDVIDTETSIERDWDIDSLVKYMLDIWSWLETLYKIS